MAVYQHTYQQYAGPTTPLRSRFLILPRYAFQGVFQSKIFTVLFVLCFLPLLIETIIIYLHHNISFLEGFQVRLADLLEINAAFFRWSLFIQGLFAFLLTVIIGPVLISRDLTNNALPLYLCRPLSRIEYVVGKMSAVMILLSAITWIPLLLLFFFQAYLVGSAWLLSNLYVAGAILVISWTGIILFALLSVALSAWVKWRIAASGAFFALFVIPTPITIMLNEMFRTYLGTLLHPGFMLSILLDKLFRLEGTGLPDWMVPPTWSVWAALLMLALLCVRLLSLKVRAYEVVK